MQLYNIKHPEQQVSFIEAVCTGLGRDRGLFFPKSVTPLADINNVIDMNFVDRSIYILQHLIGSEISPEELAKLVKNAFNFALPVVKVNQNIATLELFHGPTLAFKDFGARFMAQVLSLVAKDRKITILTATSGDTGAAVAHAFYGLDNIEVVVLYPQGKISKSQEMLFCTLGKNIKTIAIDGDFDACQALVKTAFEDQELRETIGLNSANSINISRLLAQVCYYFEIYAQLEEKARENLVISVPSGNFGNLTAGLIAKSLGLPVKRFIAATNVNDTVPRFLTNHKWEVKDTVATLANAMDVSDPNNWPRIMELFATQNWDIENLTGCSYNDEQTKQAIVELKAMGYLSEPHGAIAYSALRDKLKSDEYGVFLGTAHPAKFAEIVNDALGSEIEIPATILEHNAKPLLSINMSNDFNSLRKFLLNN